MAHWQLRPVARSFSCSAGFVARALFRLLGLAGILAGAGVFARGKLADRSRKISAAESNIRSELDDLDPVARAQVLADLARGKA